MTNLDKSACFRLMVLNNFSFKDIVGILHDSKIHANYRDIYVNAKNYLKDSLEGEQKIWHDALDNFFKDYHESERLAEQIYYTIRSFQSDLYVDVSSSIVEKVAMNLNLSKSLILEYYYLYLLKKCNIKSLENCHDNDVIYIKKYLFYVFLNYQLDISIFEYLPIFANYRHEYLQRQLEDYLKSYLLDKEFTDAEKEYLYDLVKNRNYQMPDEDFYKELFYSINRIEEKDEYDLNKIECLEKIIACIKLDTLKLDDLSLEYLNLVKFDYLDLCSVTNYSVSELYSELCKAKNHFLRGNEVVFDEKDINVFKDFSYNSCSILFDENAVIEDKELTADILLKESYTIFVDDEIHLVTGDEKMQVFKFLDEHHIPLYRRVYQSAVSRLLDGTLELRFIFWKDFELNVRNEME